MTYDLTLIAAFFHNLGVGPACSVLGGIAVLMLPILVVLIILLGRFVNRREESI